MRGAYSEQFCSAPSGYLVGAFLLSLAFWPRGSEAIAFGCLPFAGVPCVSEGCLEFGSGVVRRSRSRGVGRMRRQALLCDNEALLELGMEGLGRCVCVVGTGGSVMIGISGQVSHTKCDDHPNMHDLGLCVCTFCPLGVWVRVVVQRHMSTDGHDEFVAHYLQLPGVDLVGQLYFHVGSWSALDNH